MEKVTYRLYTCVQTWEILCISQEESDIVSTMIGHNNQFGKFHYIIIGHVNGGDFPYKGIYNEKKFEAYIEDCKERNVYQTPKSKSKKKKKGSINYS